MAFLLRFFSVLDHSALVAEVAVAAEVAAVATKVAAEAAAAALGFPGICCSNDISAEEAA